MKSLYHIKTEYQQLLNTLEELQGELSPELEEALSINESELQEKALNYVRILSELEAEISYGQAEIERAEAYVSGKKTGSIFPQRTIAGGSKATWPHSGRH